MYICCLEKALATHSGALAWRIPWPEEPGRLQSMGSLRVGHNWVTSLSLFTFMRWRRKWQPTPVFLPGESQGRRGLVGCRLWGRTESDTTEAIWQQQQHICCLVAKLCLILLRPHGLCSLPGFSVHGISQTRILEWVATSYSRGSSPPRNPNCISYIGRWFLYYWATTYVYLKLWCNTI